ncbi:sugar phosphate isomerase/epimerase family protein [Horticoccus sp. 23ND18S-11]|uniref:sugar phosphate isomerase/epimerase family protein n=1 Tax=Horticoccus sp. 23ND18S-11 TaxID=3391832 RepID=UPI0039C92249
MRSHSPTPASCSRRDFLAFSGLLPAALLAHAAGGRAFAATTPVADVAAQASGPKRFPIGLELYSVRTELMRNLPDTLRAVAKMGYEVVEFYSPYFQWTFPFAKGVRTLMDDIGLRCYSTHNSFASFTGETMAKAIELNQIIGARQLVLASPPRDATGLEGWKRTCGQLTTAVETLKVHGLAAGYHNHQTEWKSLEGGLRIMDVIAQNTPPEFILQLDVGTCMEVGVDPVAWIKANPGRIRSVHLKDWTPGPRTEEKGYRVLFGEGISPWKDIIAAAESVGGVEFYLLEQEGSRYPELETAQRCLDNWKAFRRRG